MQTPRWEVTTIECDFASPEVTADERAMTAAEVRLDEFLGRTKTIESSEVSEVLAVKDGDTIRRLVVGSEEYDEWLKRFSLECPPFHRTAWLGLSADLNSTGERMASADYIPSGLNEPTRFVGARRLLVPLGHSGFVICRATGSPVLGRLDGSPFAAMNAVRGRIHAERDIAADRRGRSRPGVRRPRPAFLGGKAVRA